MDQNDYNNGTTVQLLCFLAAEFPVQLLTKRYGFKHVLPLLMMMWSLVSWTQAFMTGKVGFYITRALIGACEGGFIPGTSECKRLRWHIHRRLIDIAVLFATYFYTSKELSVRLAAFWSTLNVARIISSLLAAGILQMRGIAGRPGWFWLFLVGTTCAWRRTRTNNLTARGSSDFRDRLRQLVLPSRFANTHQEHTLAPLVVH